MYDRVKEIAHQHKYPTFLVRLVVPKEIALQRVMEREKDSQENCAHYAKHFDSYFEDYAKFNSKQADYFLGNSGNLEQLTLTHLMEEIKKKIK